MSTAQTFFSGTNSGGTTSSDECGDNETSELSSPRAQTRQPALLPLSGLAMFPVVGGNVARSNHHTSHYYLITAPT